MSLSDVGSILILFAGMIFTVLVVAVGLRANYRRSRKRTEPVRMSYEEWLAYRESGKL